MHLGTLPFSTEVCVLTLKSKYIWESLKEAFSAWETQTKHGQIIAYAIEITCYIFNGPKSMKDSGSDGMILLPHESYSDHKHPTNSGVYWFPDD